MIERGDTKSRILDTAEKLFGMNGFESVSLRDITANAGVNLAAVNYHFQTKESLIDAVIGRRIQPVNARRLALLDSYGPSPALEQILDAFLRPVFEQDFEPLKALMGRVHSNPDLFVDRIYGMHMAPMAVRFGKVFADALPGVAPAEIAWRMTFCVGVMTHTLLWGHILPRVTNGLCSVDDREGLLARMIAFDAAGFRAAIPTL
jgi:AcrR family transcriptional regulator